VSGDDSSPSPIRDEGWIGSGGRKVVAVGILLIALSVGAYYVGGGAEEIGDFFDELAQEVGEDEGEGETTTLEDTTIKSGELPQPVEPEQPVEPIPAPEAAPEPGSPGDVEHQLDEAERTFECISRAEDAEAMAQCVQPSNP